MGSSNKHYDGPDLCIGITATEDAYQWKIKMTSADHTGSRKLGYRAEGSFLDLNAEPGKFSIDVHDETRAVWTEMPLSDRKDIRALMTTLLSAATTTMMKALKQG